MAALFREGADWATFTAIDGIAHLRRVGIGARNTHAAEIVSGLAPGDAVVLHPGDSIAEGTRLADRATLLAR